MRIRRTFPIVLTVVLIAIAIILAVQLRKRAPPEPARLLPGADAYFYVNVEWARRAAGGKDLPAVSHDPQYERFIRETGFEFERDLDKAAFAVHYPANWPGGGTGGSAPEPRFSEVLEGRFESERLSTYLRKIAQGVESYHGIDIFTVPVEGRTLRVALLSADSVAVSNHDDPAVIRGMIDHSKRLASPFGGPALLRQYYKHVQLASLAWLVARIEPPGNSPTALSFGLETPATVVVSGSVLSPLHLRPEAIELRAEAFTQNPEDARAIIDKVNVFAALTHSAESAAGVHGADKDIKTFFESIQVKQEGSRAVLKASVPYGFMRKLLAESGSEANETSEGQHQQTQHPAETPVK
jgi:hypothetical protein